jgi:phage repressor protein C with HTH and peptisase S24 domain
MIPVKETIKRAKKTLGLDRDRELADRLEIDQSNISRWKADGEIPAKQLEKLAEITGFPVDFFVKEDGDVYSATRPAAPATDESVRVAVLNQAIEAGPGAAEVSLEYTNDYLAFSAQWLRGEVGHFERDSLAVGKVKGDSMFPLVRPGDVVLVDLTDTKPAAGKIVVVYTRDRELILKRLEKHGEEWIAASENRDSESRSRKLKLGANGDVIKGKAFWRAGKI